METRVRALSLPVGACRSPSHFLTERHSRRARYDEVSRRGAGEVHVQNARRLEFYVRYENKVNLFSIYLKKSRRRVSSPPWRVDSARDSGVDDKLVLAAFARSTRSVLCCQPHEH